jgi:RNase H-like domain found in reverse transcriptase
MARPLIQLTKADVPFNFNNKCQEVFQELKRRIITAPILRHYNPLYKSMLETDASDGVIAGILS